MGFDLTQICCNSPSSSSASTPKIFCNDNFNKCNPHRCHSCCGASFLNDHTYSILKRVCHKIIKSYNRQQCCEKYTIFDGGNSIYQRCPDKQKSEAETQFERDRANRDERIDYKAVGKQQNNKKDNEIDTLDNGKQKKTYQSDKVKSKSIVKTSYEKRLGAKESGNELLDKISANNKKEKKTRHTLGKNNAVQINAVGVDSNQPENTHGKKGLNNAEPLKKSNKSGKGTTEKEKELDKRGTVRGRKGSDNVDKEIVTENAKTLDKKKRREEKNPVESKTGAANVDKEKTKLGTARGKKGTENTEKERVSANTPTADKEKGKIENTELAGVAKGRRKQSIGKNDVLDEENRIDKKKQKPLESLEEKDGKRDKDKAGKAKANKRKETLSDETNLNAILLGGKTSSGKNTGNINAQVTKNQQDRKSLNMEESSRKKKLGRKSNGETDSTNVDQKAGKSNQNYVQKSNGGKKKSGELGLAYQEKGLSKKMKAEESARIQYIGNNKLYRTEVGKIGRPRIRNRIMETKMRKNQRQSSRNRLFTQRPCRADEVRVCDILRVHLEDRDLSRCMPCETNGSQVCRCCMQSCKRFVC